MVEKVCVKDINGTSEGILNTDKKESNCFIEASTVPCLPAIRAVYQNLNCLSSSGQMHDAPKVAWLLDQRHERQGKPAVTKGKNPVASLYRMYEYLVVGHTAGLRSEMEYFFNQSTWSVKAIPDPEDTDPARYAILAVLTHYLAKVFNRLIERGLPRGCPAIIAGAEAEAELRAREVVLELQPSWAKAVRRLDEPITIPNSSGKTPEDRFRSAEFLAMNIIVTEPHVAFV
ncbi:hypothetical protein Focb16_v010582 [Fusarium oxysporum f. sp. cubense]|uniref:Uncharacterized protein n=1 Tax=Fusarium oxysporum f. sp. cubense TaxID=61366 RepID=A0A559L022_FUSOC|nr:hypothetical protein Focb16_v010582 [Fusarium oxysporum f. sp. cubense]